MKRKSFFLLLILIVCLIIKYRLYNDLIPKFVYKIINPRQVEGILNITFYLGIIIQIVLIVLLTINYKKMKIQDYIIGILSLIFLISFIILMLSI